MGIIKAAYSAGRGMLADQWLDVIEPKNLTNQTLFARGIKVTKGSQNKGSADVITDGSIIRVNENMIMLLVDGGKIIDYSAEPGYFKVENNSAPSMLNGDLEEAVTNTFERFKFAGITPQKQEVFYINLIEIAGIKFGTTSPIQYFDNFYNAEMFLRMFGTYSIKITDPLLFYTNVVSKSADRFDVSEFNGQYQQEFLVALSSMVTQYSVDGEGVSYLSSKGTEISSSMKKLLADKWRELRGIDVVSVAIANFSYDDKSQKIINSRNRGASIGGAVKALLGGTQGNQAIKKAKENAKLDKILKKAETKWTCPKCKAKSTGKFCSECGEKTPTSNDRAYKPCSGCGVDVDITDNIPKFCPECGDPFVLAQ